MPKAIDCLEKKPRGPLTPWELPSLLTPLHKYRRSEAKPKKEREHFAAILAFVYRNRFAVASQVQRRFARFLRSDRTTRRHLEELQNLGYLDVVPARGVSPLFPKVYYVTGKGMRKLKGSFAAQGKSWQASRIDRRSRDAREGYSADRIIHEILITEFMLALWQTIQKKPDLELLTVQRRSVAKCKAFEITVGRRKTRLVPDGMFLFRQKDAGMCCCFLELDNGTMNAKQIRAKYARYAAWARSSHGQQYLIELYRRNGAQNPSIAFRLLIVARSRTGQDDDARMAELLAVARQAPASVCGRIWLTTVTELCRHQHDDLPLAANLWVRAGKLGHLSAADSVRSVIYKASRYSLFPSKDAGTALGMPVKPEP